MKNESTTITILADNRSLDETRFPVEHGLSIFLETGGKRLLLDTGASGLFARNARELGVDLSLVDYVFLSHGHADHAGGLATFLSLNSKARIIVSPQALSGHFLSARHFLHDITPSWPLNAMNGRLIAIDSLHENCKEMKIITHIPHNHPLPQANRQLFVERNGIRQQDDFGHELALYINGVLFSGCAHSGIENILEACPWPVTTVLGGFHLLDSHLADNYETESELKTLAYNLKTRYPETLFLTSHCTGPKAFQTMKAIMGEKLQTFCCGMTIKPI